MGVNATELNADDIKRIDHKGGFVSVSFFFLGFRGMYAWVGGKYDDDLPIIFTEDSFNRKNSSLSRKVLRKYFFYNYIIFNALQYRRLKM